MAEENPDVSGDEPQQEVAAGGDKDATHASQEEADNGAAPANEAQNDENDGKDGAMKDTTTQEKNDTVASSSTDKENEKEKGNENNEDLKENENENENKENGSKNNNDNNDNNDATTAATDDSKTESKESKESTDGLTDQRGLPRDDTELIKAKKEEALINETGNVELGNGWKLKQTTKLSKLKGLRGEEQHLHTITCVFIISKMVDGKMQDKEFKLVFKHYEIRKTSKIPKTSKEVSLNDRIVYDRKKDKPSTIPFIEIYLENKQPEKVGVFIDCKVDEKKKRVSYTYEVQVNGIAIEKAYKKWLKTRNDTNASSPPTTDSNGKPINKKKAALKKPKPKKKNDSKSTGTGAAKSKPKADAAGKSKSKSKSKDTKAKATTNSKSKTKSGAAAAKSGSKSKSKSKSPAPK